MKSKCHITTRIIPKGVKVMFHTDTDQERPIQYNVSDSKQIQF